MEKNKIRLYELLHFADSAFPIGGFAYSNGMEYAVKSQIINSVNDLWEYLISYMSQLYQFDMAFVKEASSAKTLEELQDISEMYNAMLLNPAIKKSGLVLGRNWMSILKNLYKVPNVEWYQKLDQDFLIVYANTLGGLGFSTQEICDLFVFMNVRDQLSVVVRLGTLGPSKSHQLQKKILNHIAENYTIDSIPKIEDASKNAYVLELCQLSHKYLYTKLFQN